MKNKYIILACIVLLAALLRFWNLSSNPPELNNDEAAWGYNAYSIGTDGKDEYGRFLPHDYLESFGDFKPPVYVYLDVLPVKVLGLNAFATRFPSAFFGTFTVLVTFFLVKRIFYREKLNDYIALASAFVLAISPWHILLSRAAFEANVATFFIVSGVWLFLTAVQNKKWYLILSAICFVISMYTFNTARIVTPLLVLVLAVGSYKWLLKEKKVAVIAAIVGLLLFLPTVKFLLSPQAGLRYQEVNIFSDTSLITTSNQEIANDNNSPISKIIHNHRLIFATAYIKHYFDNLSPQFLFVSGDENPKFSIHQVGEEYLVWLPFFLIGILALFKKRQGSWWVIPLWFIIGIVPAATAQQTPHALRIETTIPTVQIFIAYGVITTWLFINQRKFSPTVLKTAYGVFGILLFVSVFYFLYNYAVLYPARSSSAWSYGYRDIMSYVQQQNGRYQDVVISDYLGKPYIYYLFYNHINPSYFRNNSTVERDNFGFVNVSQIGNIYFVRDTASINGANGKTLYIDYYKNIPKSGIVVKKQFYFLDGTKSMSAYEKV